MFVTLLGTILTLIIKQWLMACTFATLPTLLDYELDSDIEDIMSHHRNEKNDKAEDRERKWRAELERITNLKKASAQRKVEMRRTRRHSCP